jgi:hypothetical protein
MSGALLTAGTVATAAIADGAAKPRSAGESAPMPENVQRELPRHPPIVPARVKPRSRPHHKIASRQHTRQTLVGSPRTIAHALVLRQGWSESQFGCLDRLWMRESDWQVYAHNPSGAYGIPQALPGSKMAMMGADWRTNPITQIRWGLYYIANSYGTPCAALEHSYRYNYY